MTTTRQRYGNLIQTALLVPAVILLPFLVALLFNAMAEAFLGDKEPMLQSMLGLWVGILLAGGLGVGILRIRQAGMRKTAWAMWFALLSGEILAIPLARWLVHWA